MDYKDFESIFNNKVFNETKKEFIENLIKYGPKRLDNLFSANKLNTKIVGNIIQSYNIKFGNAFEDIITAYIKEFDFKIHDDIKKSKQIDIVFSDDESIFFIEMKVKDDHDSTKKKGQIKNFKDKIAFFLCNNESQNILENKTLKGYFYFIDDQFKKNKKFYDEEINNINQDYANHKNEPKFFVLYGSYLFNEIPKCKDKALDIWEEIKGHLEEWRKKLPDIPEINFDKSPKESFEIIKTIKVSDYKKLFKEEFDNLLKILFPNAFNGNKQSALKLLKKYFNNQKDNKEIAILIDKTISRIKSNKDK